LQDAQKSTSDQQITLLSSSLEETKVELSAATSAFAQQEESLRLQLSAATSNATDVSAKYEEKLVVLQKLENELRSVVAQKERCFSLAHLLFLFIAFFLF
jgi:hypothetical protein